MNVNGQTVKETPSPLIRSRPDVVALQGGLLVAAGSGAPGSLSVPDLRPRIHEARVAVLSHIPRMRRLPLHGRGAVILRFGEEDSYRSPPPTRIRRRRPACIGSETGSSTSWPRGSQAARRPSSSPAT
jgi:hypothetical protein